VSKDQFEVWEFDFPGRGRHPVVLISHPDRCARAEVVNVLFCTSQRQSRAIKPFEVMLNGEDGMDWESFCDCSILWAVASRELKRKRGRVSLERRRQLRSKLKDLLRLSATD
jgi:mRNA-degrading endonuclease toxin of MazEF toxin-antitoxin module